MEGERRKLKPPWAKDGEEDAEAERGLEEGDEDEVPTRGWVGVEEGKNIGVEELVEGFEG